MVARDGIAADLHGQGAALLAAVGSLLDDGPRVGLLAGPAHDVAANIRVRDARTHANTLCSPTTHHAILFWGARSQARSAVARCMQVCFRVCYTHVLHALRKHAVEASALKAVLHVLAPPRPPTMFLLVPTCKERRRKFER